MWNGWFIGYFYFPNYFLQIATQRLKEKIQENVTGVVPVRVPLVSLPAGLPQVMH